MKRFADWEDRLRTYLDRVEEEPFQWGTHDCALFAMSCVHAQTGEDLAAVYRGKYTDKAGAAAALREYGQGTLFRTLKSLLGDPTSIHFAKRGDLVMPNAYSVGVCVGQYSWFVGEEQGQQRLAILPTSGMKYAFTVPFDDADQTNG
jgi:hypothetical protein